MSALGNASPPAEAVSPEMLGKQVEDQTAVLGHLRHAIQMFAEKSARLAQNASPLTLTDLEVIFTSFSFTICNIYSHARGFVCVDASSLI